MNDFQDTAALYRFNEKVLERCVEGFMEADWLRRAEGPTSHSYWILGHLAVSRRRLLRGLGEEVAVANWEEGFTRGSKPGESSGPMTAAALVEDFRSTGARLEERLRALTPEDAALQYGRTFPDGSSTRGGAARFLLWHETSHVGQLAMLRRVAGKPGIAG
jgi:hypothetical protein